MMECSSSVESVIGNDDVLSEILSFLSVKHLLQLQTLNKQCHSLISNPSFRLLHSLRHHHHRLPSSALFFRLHHPSPSSFHFVPLLSPTRPRPPPFYSRLLHDSDSDCNSNACPMDIMQSCNGLLLCSPSRVCNPTTGQVTCFPAPPARPFLLGLSLAFDPFRSPHYSLLSVWKDDGEDGNEGSLSMDLYNSSTRQWRPVQDCCFSAPFDVEFDRGVYCHGRVYWLSHTHSTVVFNLDTECVECLSLPEPMEGVYIQRFRYFGESCGHLHLIEIRTNCVPDFEVLELVRRSENDEVHWVVKYRVNLDQVGRGFESQMFQDHSDRFGRPLRFYAFSILALIRGAEDGDSGRSHGGACHSHPQLVVSVPGRVISYDLITNLSTSLCDVVDQTDRWLPFKAYNAFQFIESLYCL